METQNVYKVTLSEEKIVYLREPRIGDTETAAAVAGKNAGDNQALMAIKMQKEFIKLLLVQVNDKKLTLTDKEQLDKFFNFKEYGQLAKVVQKITGDEQGNDPTIDFSTIGDK